MLTTAIASAKAAGAVLEHYFEMSGLEREQKDDKSFATQADKESEAVIAQMIRDRFPDHGFVGEEGGSWNEGAEYQWVVDPLDGTGNFLNGIPLFAVSIALVHKGMPIAGVVYNPVTESLFCAEVGKGAFYNSKPIRVSDQTPEWGLVTIAPGRGDTERARALFPKVSPHMKSVRFLGCTALELAYLARGGTEGYICMGLSPWDYAAGQLLVTEAGGKITDYQGNQPALSENYFVASNGVCHDAVLKIANSV